MTPVNPRLALESLWRGGETWPEGSWQNRVRTAAAILLALIVFAVDTFTALAGAVAVLYCLILLVAGEGRHRRVVIWTAIGCLGLAFGSFIWNHGFLPDEAPDFRFLFSLAAILTTGFLLLRQAKTRQLHGVQARLLEVTADAIILRSCDGDVLLWNHGAEELYGWSRGEMIGEIHHDLLHSRFAIPRPEIRTQLRAEGEWSGEVEQQRKDGTVVTVSSRWQLLRTPEGESWAVLETSTDITARREAERNLQRSERRYRNIFEMLAVAVLEYDFRPLKDKLDAARADGMTDVAAYYRANPALLAALRSDVSVVNANETAVRLFAEESRGSFVTHYRHYLPFSDEKFVHCLIALNARAAHFEAPAEAVASNGETLSLLVAMTFPFEGDELDCVQASITDLTGIERMSDEISRMRADLDQAMRAATIGEISASIAHEVNQPLAAMKTYVSAARRWLGHDPANIAEATVALGDAIEAATRAGHVVKKVRQLFDRGIPETQSVVIDTMIGDTLRLVARDISDSATHLVVELRATGAVVTGSKVLLQQSILNLTTNALQAMSSRPDGERRLTISSEIKDDYVIITVEDTGPGFSPEVVHHATDAFFSTRKGGMGIGLAVCRSTVLSSGGEIELSNRSLGTGAIARLRFPFTRYLDSGLAS